MTRGHYDIWQDARNIAIDIADAIIAEKDIMPLAIAKAIVNLAMAGENLVQDHLDLTRKIIELQREATDFVKKEES